MIKPFEITHNNTVNIMPDMLVKLYDLPALEPLTTQLRAANIDIRGAETWEKRVISAWAQTHFGNTWAIACEVALEQRPVSCLVAVEKVPTNGVPADPSEERLIGFACYDVASRGMFGPTGVIENYRGRGIGKALLLHCLHTMTIERYAYAIIGQVGPVEFYAKTVGAVLIEGSDPGVAHRTLIG